MDFIVPATVKFKSISNIMLIVHHLQRGQSERIIWLLEELEIPYELKIHKRDSKTFLAPPELANLYLSSRSSCQGATFTDNEFRTAAGAAPVVQDGDVTLAESGAIVEYILAKYGNGKLAISPSTPDAKIYAEYLYFLHFSNAYLQAGIMRYGMAKAAKLGPDIPAARITYRNFDRGLQILDDRFKEKKWLAGDEFTAADVMMVWCVTTCRLFAPFSLKGYDGILRWLQDVGARPGYRRAMQKGDPGMKPYLGAEAPERISAEKL